MNLCNIVLAYIGGTFQTKDFPQDGIMCGLMGALINLNLQNLGILYMYSNMTSGCKMMWSFLGSGHGKGPWP